MVTTDCFGSTADGQAAVMDVDRPHFFMSCGSGFSHTWQGFTLCGIRHRAVAVCIEPSRAILFQIGEKHRHGVQGNSVLAAELAKVFGIPLKVLTTEDLRGETLDSLRERFGFDPKEVALRAADFTL